MAHVEIKLPKVLINEPKHLVNEALRGFLSTNASLCSLPTPKVLLRRDWDRDTTTQVALVSGGGSGHEPAHVGYVGKGILTAAVCGEVFASPSTEAVLAAIHAVARPGGPGVLLIVKNYTGDRINFGLAAEMAKAEGIDVELVVVADDCALPKDQGITGGRGIAGTVLIHKIAGAAAAENLTLREVVQVVKEASMAIRSFGISLSSCTIPGQVKEERLQMNEIELGLGIHGEPGSKRMSMASADALVDVALHHIVEGGEQFNCLPFDMKVDASPSAVLLVNNLGTATPMEIGVITNSAVNWLERRCIKPEIVLQGSFMTSLDMHGFSLSLLRLDQANRASILSRLLAEAHAPAWPRVQLRTTQNDVAQQEQHEPRSPITARQGESGDNLVSAAIRAAALALIKNEPLLTQYDRIAGDGDCGLTFRAGAERILEDLPNFPTSDLALTLQALSVSIAHSMGGTSGALYRLLFTAAHCSLKDKQVTEVNVAEAAAMGIQAIQRYGGASLGQRTMLDALIPAAEAFKLQLGQHASWREALSAAATEAEQGAEATMRLAARAGRSNYVPAELLSQVPDPGATAAAIWIRSLCVALSGAEKRGECVE